MMSAKNAVPTGTVTFLFTDIEGSTKLAQQYPEELPGLLARHDEILKSSILASNGFVFQVVGDAFCAAFHSAGDALHAAVAAQLRLHDESWSPAPIKVRMGIHAGRAEYQGDSVYQGYLTLSHAQRLMSAAHGGQVLISLAAQDLVLEDVPDGVTLRDMGERRLKDMVRPEHVYQLVIPGLPDQFPPLKTLDARRHNLPAPITSFVGREREIREVQDLIHAHRLVTLTGSGGAGKTRLSLEVGAAILDQFPDGVWLAELAPVSDAALVPQAVLSILSLREDPRRTAFESLTDYLREKSLLLLLDNCEHLIPACAQLADGLLRACPGLKMIASSREALGVAGEVAYRVPSLSTPDPGHMPSLDELRDVDSIRLFLERASTAMPGFTLTSANARSVAEICSRLDGIPLAIELAAARLRVLSPEQIASRLDDRFRLLTGGARTALPRQQTLRATIDWSYSLLSEPEKVLFRRLAVFVGGWTLQAAESVCGDEAALDVLDVLTHLLDKSLIFLDESTDEVRYHRLETIRQYSREKLLETDEVEWLRDRHLDFFVGFSEAVDEHLQGRDQLLWQRRMAAEQDNLRAALEWGLARNPDAALRICGASNLFWTAGGFSAEGLRWTQEALQRVEAIPLPQGVASQQRLLERAKALRGLTRLYLSLGDNANARRVAEESVTLYRQSSDRRGLAFALVILAYPLEFLAERQQAENALLESYEIARAEGDTYVMCRALNRLARVIIDLHQDLDLSQKYLEESMYRAREAGLRSQEAQANEVLAMIAIRRKEFSRAYQYLNESLRMYDEIGATFNVTLEKSNIAHLARQLGQYEDALVHYRETILAFRDIGQTGAVAHQLECIGFIALAQDQADRAVQLFAAADRLRENNNTPMTPDEHVYFGQQVAAARAALGPAGFTSLWSQGTFLTMDQAIELALN